MTPDNRTIEDRLRGLEHWTVIIWWCGVITGMWIVIIVLTLLHIGFCR